MGLTGLASLRTSKCSIGRLTLPAHAGGGELLAALDLLAALNRQRVGMAVDRDGTVVVADEDRIAQLLQAIAGIDDHAVLGCLDRRAFRNRDVDTVIALAVDIGAIAGDHRATNGPAILADAGCLRRGFLRIGGMQLR